MNTPRDKVDHLLKGGCKQIAVLDDSGDAVVGFNQYPQKEKPDPIKPKREQILKFFTIAPAGEYEIVGRTSPRAQPVRIPHNHLSGEKVTTNEEQPIHTPLAEPMEQVLTYKEALRMATEIAELRSEIARLKADNAALQAELDEIASDLEAESEQNLADENLNSVTKIVETGLPMVIALADKWFALQEQKVNAMQQRPMYQAPPRPMPNNQEQDYDPYQSF
jgi:hypothetical protein